MSLAFHVEVSDSRLLSRLARLPWVLVLLSGTAAGAQHLERSASLREVPGLEWVVLALGCALSWWVWVGGARRWTARWAVPGAPSWPTRSQSFSVGARLQVDDAGHLRFAPPGGSVGAASVTRVLRLPHLMVLYLTPSVSEDLKAPRWRLLLARDALGADDWRKICVWVRWLERGPHDGS